MVEDPAQRHLHHIHAFRHVLAQFLGKLDAFFVTDGFEGFAYIEGLPIAVEVAVVALR